MEQERPLIEQVRNAIDAFAGVYLSVVVLAISLAMLVMGNTLARVIGLLFLCLLFLQWARHYRSRAQE
jgi:hypothetical protein